MVCPGVETEEKGEAVKAIETQYSGYRFRSRLEARWAVFFDTMGYPYLYEPEGFDLGKDGWYLPDFLLGPESDGPLWVEIKPKRPSIEEVKKMNALSFHTNTTGLIIYGEVGCEANIIVTSKEQESPTDAYLLTWILASALEAGDGQERVSGITRSLYLATSKSKSARFEHGETPRAT